MEVVERKKPKTAKEFYTPNFPPKVNGKHAVRQIPVGKLVYDGKPSNLDTELSKMAADGTKVLGIKRHGGADGHYDVTVMVQR